VVNRYSVRWIARIGSSTPSPSIGVSSVDGVSSAGPAHGASAGAVGGVSTGTSTSTGDASRRRTRLAPAGTGGDHGVEPSPVPTGETEPTHGMEPTSPLPLGGPARR